MQSKHTEREKDRGIRRKSIVESFPCISQSEVEYWRYIYVCVRAFYVILSGREYLNLRYELLAFIIDRARLVPISWLYVCVIKL